MLGVDMGGTKISLGRVGISGCLLGDYSLCRVGPPPGACGAPCAYRATVRKENRASGPRRGSGVGVGCAGTIDRENGVVVTSPNLPLETPRWSVACGRIVPLPVIVETRRQRGRGCGAPGWVRPWGCSTWSCFLGTGIGGALILGGLYRARTGGAGQLGHMVVEVMEGLECGRPAAGAAVRLGTGVNRWHRNVGLFERGAFSGESVGALAREGVAAAKWRSPRSPTGWGS